jgi:uncharacterized protein YndB with AHSA1/START domain
VSRQRLQLIAPPDQPVLVFRREFAAPATLLFRAWTEPEHLRHWRVPHGFELVTCEVDLRVGGAYRFVQQAPDGSRHAFRGRYRQIERPARLVSVFSYEAAPETEILDEVTFEDTGGRTLVTGRTTFPSYAAREFYAAAGAEHGLAQCHQRLDQLLAAGAR